MRNLLVKASAVLGAAGVGVAAGLLFTSGSAATSDSDVVAVPDYPQNAAGETYGSAFLADREEDEPDLIAATGTNDKDGFVRKADLSPEPPSSPAEAVALTKAYETKTRSGGPAKVIPLYAKDGETIIGEFELTYDPDADPVVSTQE